MAQRSKKLQKGSINLTYLRKVVLFVQGVYFSGVLALCGANQFDIVIIVTVPFVLGVALSYQIGSLRLHRVLVSLHMPSSSLDTMVVEMQDMTRRIVFGAVLMIVGGLGTVLALRATTGSAALEPGGWNRPGAFMQQVIFFFFVGVLVQSWSLHRYLHAKLRGRVRTGASTGTSSEAEADGAKERGPLAVSSLRLSSKQQNVRNSASVASSVGGERVAEE